MREESLIPQEIGREEVIPEIMAMSGRSDTASIEAFMKELHEVLPTARSDEEMIAMEVRAALHIGHPDISEEVAHIVTDALCASAEMKERALMVAHKILRAHLQ